MRQVGKLETLILPYLINYPSIRKPPFPKIGKLRTNSLQLDTMPALELRVIPNQTQAGLAYQHLHVQINNPNGIIEPQDLKELELPKDMIWSQGVVIEGKAPIWLYDYLVHECHPAAWVAGFDPRLGEASPRSGGAVVVSTHSPKVSVGQVLIINLPDALF